MKAESRLVLNSFMVLSLGFASSSAFAATFNDAANGNWNDGATWGNTSPGSEGVDFPGPNDEAVIDSHSVTITANQIVNNVTLSSGTFSLGANTLTVRGAFTHSSGVFNGGTSTVVLANLSSTTLDVSGGTTFNNLEIGESLTTSGLIAYWKLDQGSGTTAADSSGHGSTATLVNADADDWVSGSPNVPLVEQSIRAGLR